MRTAYTLGARGLFCFRSEAAIVGGEAAIEINRGFPLISLRKKNLLARRVHCIVLLGQTRLMCC